jgi:hypothetical protein
MTPQDNGSRVTSAPTERAAGSKYPTSTVWGLLERALIEAGLSSPAARSPIHVGWQGIECPRPQPETIEEARPIRPSRLYDRAAGDPRPARPNTVRAPERSGFTQPLGNVMRTARSAVSDRSYDPEHVAVSVRSAPRSSDIRTPALFLVANVQVRIHEMNGRASAAVITAVAGVAANRAHDDASRRESERSISPQKPRGHESSADAGRRPEQDDDQRCAPRIGGLQTRWNLHSPAGHGRSMPPRR